MDKKVFIRHGFTTKQTRFLLQKIHYPLLPNEEKGREQLNFVATKNF